MRGSTRARRRYTPEQITAASRSRHSGKRDGSQVGVAENTLQLWKKRYGNLGTPEIRELSQLREENVRLKRLVADLTFDKKMLQDVLSKKW
jgi:putative transposase